MSGRKTGADLRGLFTALVTPFDDAGQVDEAALGALVRRQVAAGVHGLAPCGTTGEGATLHGAEPRRVIEIVVREAAGRVPVMAGCGSNSTARTCEAAVQAAAAGADALLVVSPDYNKPNRAGMLEHYREIAAATDLPVCVYNVPGRTGQNLGAGLILELADLPGVAAVKEASGDLEQVAAILERRPAGFRVLGGDDALALPAIALGADGLVSVVSNEAPSETAALVDAALAGRTAEARELHYRLLPLMRANFAESNPVPVKAALALLGLCGEGMRPPLAAASGSTREALALALRHARLADGAP